VSYVIRQKAPLYSLLCTVARAGSTTMKWTSKACPVPVKSRQLECACCSVAACGQRRWPSALARKAPGGNHHDHTCSCRCPCQRNPSRLQPSPFSCASAHEMSFAPQWTILSWGVRRRKNLSVYWIGYCQGKGMPDFIDLHSRKADVWI